MLQLKELPGEKFEHQDTSERYEEREKGREKEGYTHQRKSAEEIEKSVIIS